MMKPFLQIFFTLTDFLLHRVNKCTQIAHAVKLSRRSHGPRCGWGKIKISEKITLFCRMTPSKSWREPMVQVAFGFPAELTEFKCQVTVCTLSTVQIRQGGQNLHLAVLLVEKLKTNAQRLEISSICDIMILYEGLCWKVSTATLSLTKSKRIVA